MIVGRNAIKEAIRSGQQIEKILVAPSDGTVSSVIREAKDNKIPVFNVSHVKLDRLAPDLPHQGVVAFTSEKEYVTVEEIVAIAEEKGEKPLIAIADGIEDPHNLGALIRCAECAGAHGLIIPKRHSCGITPVVVKSSAGSIWHLPIARTGNIAETVNHLKEMGIWTFAAAADGEPYYDLDFSYPTALVFGNEGAGISRLVRERCDYTVSIPMYGKVNSLNVSTAASVLLCHASRILHGH